MGRIHALDVGKEEDCPCEAFDAENRHQLRASNHDHEPPAGSAQNNPNFGQASHKKSLWNACLYPSSTIRIVNLSAVYSRLQRTLKYHNSHTICFIFIKSHLKTTKLQGQCHHGIIPVFTAFMAKKMVCPTGSNAHAYTLYGFVKNMILI
jgi:hypothetical protein